MSDEINFRFIGWCKNNSHDKVWVSFEVGHSYYCAWGKRGKRLSFKKHTDRSLKVIENAKKTYYKEVDSFLLFSVFPYFKDELEKELILKLLTNKVK